MEKNNEKIKYNSITEVDLERLKEDGIKGLLLDVDGTLTKLGKLRPGVKEWVDRAKELQYKIALISNNPVIDSNVLKELNIEHVKLFACKPLIRSFVFLASQLEINPETTMVIGNNSVIDILGANRAGMQSLKVRIFRGRF